MTRPDPSSVQNLLASLRDGTHQAQTFRLRIVRSLHAGLPWEGWSLAERAELQELLHVLETPAWVCGGCGYVNGADAPCCQRPGEVCAWSRPTEGARS